MFRYVDLYMQHKPPSLRHVVLNVYGGESLHHPRIVEILEQVRVRHEPYADRWTLAVCTTTNAIISVGKLARIIPLIDEFTVSYHTENSDKNKQLFRDNVLTIAQAGKRLKCIVLMHTDPKMWADAEHMVAWCKDNNIRHLPRHLDDPSGTIWNYSESQITWFNSLYQSRSHGPQEAIPIKDMRNLSDTGRACCGGRQVCQDANYRDRQFYVIDNKFTDWYCSVNWFFLYVKQIGGMIYHNKDCRMTLDGAIGPAGNLANADKILADLEQRLSSGTLPVIQCKKYNCLCGLCAPKARDFETYQRIIAKYQTI